MPGARANDDEPVAFGSSRKWAAEFGHMRHGITE